MKEIAYFACFPINEIIQAIWGPWREGAPANRATRLLTHSPLLHTNSECAVSAIWAAAKHNKQNGHPGKLFDILFQLPARIRAFSLSETHLLHLSLHIDCHSVLQIHTTPANGNYQKILFTSPFFAVYLTSASRDSPARTVSMVKNYPA